MDTCELLLYGMIGLWCIFDRSYYLWQIPSKLAMPDRSEQLTEVLPDHVNLDFLDLCSIQLFWINCGQWIWIFRHSLKIIIWHFFLMSFKLNYKYSWVYSIHSLCWLLMPYDACKSSFRSLLIVVVEPVFHCQITASFLHSIYYLILFKFL